MVGPLWRKFYLITMDVCRQGWHFENIVTNHSSNLTFVCCIFIDDKNVLDAHPLKWFDSPSNLNSVNENQAEPCG